MKPDQQDRFFNDYLYKLLRGDIVYLQILISIIKYERRKYAYIILIAEKD